MTFIPRQSPLVKLSAEEQICIASPNQALSYEEADAKIRDGADSFFFKASESTRGRVDVVSLGTKIPSEDHWDVGVVTGEDGHETLYAGIYDGHK